MVTPKQWRLCICDIGQHKTERQNWSAMADETVWEKNLGKQLHPKVKELGNP